MANLMKMKLEEEGISVFVINKRDSAYLNFGNIELYVHQNDFVRAKYTVEKTNE